MLQASCRAALFHPQDGLHLAIMQNQECLASVLFPVRPELPVVGFVWSGSVMTRSAAPGALAGLVGRLACGWATGQCAASLMVGIKRPFGPLKSPLLLSPPPAWGWVDCWPVGRGRDPGLLWVAVKGAGCR